MISAKTEFPHEDDVSTNHPVTDLNKHGSASLENRVIREEDVVLHPLVGLKHYIRAGPGCLWCVLCIKVFHTRSQQ